MTSVTITGTGRVSTAFVKWSKEHGLPVECVSYVDCVKGSIPPCEILIHAGARVFADKSLISPLPYIGDNVFGTFTMLEYARTKSLNLFVFISTHEALDPQSPYAATKKCGEVLTEAWGKSYGIPYLIVRLPNLFIVNQDDKGYIGGILRGEIKEPRTPDRVRQWMTGEQFSEAMWVLINFGDYNRTVSLQGVEKTDAEIMAIVKSGGSL